MIDAVTLAILGMIQGACTWEYDRYDADRLVVFREFLRGATARGWQLAPHAAKLYVVKDWSGEEL